MYIIYHIVISISYSNIKVNKLMVVTFGKCQIVGIFLLFKKFKLVIINIHISIEFKSKNPNDIY